LSAELFGGFIRPLFFGGFIRRELRDVWQSLGWTFHAQSGTRHLLCDETGRNGCVFV
jgi:hypothetical protein